MASEWATIRLGEVCTKIGSGATPRGGSEVYLENGPYSFIRSQNVYNDGFHHEGLAFISESQAQDLKNVEVQRGDVLLNITGDSVARACQVDPDILPARVNQHVAIIRPDPRKLNSKFLRYVLISPNIQARLLMWAGAGATRSALTKEMIESLEIDAPNDVHQQYSIARILGSLDDKIELNRKMNETLEAMARALFKSWFVDFDPVRAKAEGRPTGLPAHITALFPDSFQDSPLGDIPKGWRVGSLSDVAFLNPESWSRTTKPEIIRYIDLANTKWGRIEAITVYSKEDAPSRAQRVLRCGDTIVGTVRPGNGSYALIAEDGLTGSTGFAVLRPRKSECREFIYLTATAQDNIESLAHLADGGAYPAVRPEVVIAKLIVMPPDAVIANFAKLTEPLISRLAQGERESNTLVALRDTLLPKLISGELRVKTSQSEQSAPAEVCNG